MSQISIDSASTVNRDQASVKTTHPHSTKQRSQYTLKLKKKKKVIAVFIGQKPYLYHFCSGLVYLQETFTLCFL